MKPNNLHNSSSALPWFTWHATLPSGSSEMAKACRSANGFLNRSRLKCCRLNIKGTSIQDEENKKDAQEQLQTREQLRQGKRDLDPGRGEQEAGHFQRALLTTLQIVAQPELVAIHTSYCSRLDLATPIQRCQLALGSNIVNMEATARKHNCLSLIVACWLNVSASPLARHLGHTLHICTNTDTLRLFHAVV